MLHFEHRNGTVHAELGFRYATYNKDGRFFPAGPVPKNPSWLVPKIRQLGCSQLDPLERVIHMPELPATCPTTRKRLSTGIPTDPTTLAKVWFSDIRVKCPHCGKSHAIKVREAYVESALSSDGMRECA
jgi:hypothetical protein